MTSENHENRNDTQQPRTTDLHTLSAKLFAIGELIKFRGGEQSLDEERVHYGLGEMLTDLANDLRKG
jgi:hypothetical protein